MKQAHLRPSHTTTKNVLTFDLWKWIFSSLLFCVCLRVCPASVSVNVCVSVCLAGGWLSTGKIL